MVLGGMGPGRTQRCTAQNASERKGTRMHFREGEVFLAGAKSTVLPLECPCNCRETSPPAMHQHVITSTGMHIAYAPLPAPLVHIQGKASCQNCFCL